MGAFRSRLEATKPRDERGRRWIFVAYDQLTSEFGPLARTPPRELGIVLVEAPLKAERRPYHKQKLALVLANLRHFAIEQAARGVAVRHIVAKGTYGDALVDVAREVGPLETMVPAERELRVDLAEAVERGAVRYVFHEGWLTTRDDFLASHDGPPWRMDAFYRRVRARTGILMKRGKPEGGKYSFDPENRKRWPGKPRPPSPPTFRPDDVTREVGDLVEAKFGHHPGTLRLETLPATARDAERYWQWAKKACLPAFGPYEDAMSARSRRLFHSGISALLNLSRLPAARIVADAVESDAPLASREGFVRQILGWREFVHHVHVETDGFRALPGVTTAKRPGDGGHARWAGKKWPTSRKARAVFDGGADPRALAEDVAPVPPAFWGEPSGFACVDHVVEAVWDEAYSHHITRLMVISNLATLLDVSPRELTDWFWVAYADAYDWVVEPNVLAMGTFGTGDVMTTKPYVSGAAYIDKMSDFCERCAFDPHRNCPFTRLYWAFLERHRDVLEGNPRMRLPIASVVRRSRDDKRRDARTFEQVREKLSRGERSTPDEPTSFRRPRPLAR